MPVVAIEAAGSAEHLVKNMVEREGVGHFGPLIGNWVLIPVIVEKTVTQGGLVGDSGPQVEFIRRVNVLLCWQGR